MASRRQFGGMKEMLSRSQFPLGSRVPNFKGVLRSNMRALTSPIIIAKAYGGPIFNKPTSSFVANVTNFAKTRPIKEILLEVL